MDGEAADREAADGKAGQDRRRLLMITGRILVVTGGSCWQGVRRARPNAVGLLAGILEDDGVTVGREPYKLDPITRDGQGDVRRRGLDVDAGMNHNAVTRGRSVEGGLDGSARLDDERSRGRRGRTKQNR